MSTLFLLGSLNALPLTVAGLLLALVTGSRLMTVREGAALFQAGPGIRWFFTRFGVVAFAWGATIICARELQEETVRHELVHFRQARTFGVLLPILYGLASLSALLKGGHPYRDNYFERQARQET